MKIVSTLVVLSSLAAAITALVSGPDPIPWPNASRVARVLASGPDPIPWPTIPKLHSAC
jgi:hypothetical protein